ncbi:Urotensin-2 [Oryzias melastigma]|uniref:Urotensin-2 n=1 Tax=Oryzias melastigma TaxID=30732 RepID=A0A834F4L6_ORYME|nr:Urotensin-2 [Oryzias melastigma]
MKCNHFLSWAFVLMAFGPLLAHPIIDSAEMPYSGPASVEEQGISALDDLSLSEQTFPSQDSAGLRYSSLISGNINRDGFFGEAESSKPLQPHSRRPERIQEAFWEL